MNNNPTPRRIITRPETVDYTDVERLITWATDCRNPQYVWASLASAVDLLISFRGRVEKTTSSPKTPGSWSVDIIAEVEVWAPAGWEIDGQEAMLLIGHAELRSGEDDPVRVRAAFDAALEQADYRGIVEASTDPNKPLDFDGAADYLVVEATWPGYHEDDVDFGMAVLEAGGEYRGTLTSMGNLRGWSCGRVEREVAKVLQRAASDVYACPVGGDISGEGWGFAGYQHHASTATTSSAWAIKVRRV